MFICFYVSIRVYVSLPPSVCACVSVNVCVCVCVFNCPSGHVSSFINPTGPICSNKNRISLKNVKVIEVTHIVNHLKVLVCFCLLVYLLSFANIKDIFLNF